MPIQSAESELPESTAHLSPPSVQEPQSPAPNSHRSNAFTVLNFAGDVLPAAGKPNAIVRPTRRRADPATDYFGGGGGGGGGRAPHPDGGHINHSALFEYVDNGAVQRPAYSPRPPPPQPQPLPPPAAGMDKFSGDTNFGLGSFTRELDLKLRRLQSSANRNTPANGADSAGPGAAPSTANSAPKRPLFVTTVPTGIFLQPCRDQAAAAIPTVASARRAYAYFSIPRILAGVAKCADGAPPAKSGRGGRSKRDLPQNQRIVRGSNYNQQQQQHAGDGDSLAAAKEAESRRRKLLRQRIPVRNQRGIIGTPPPVQGRKHEDVQTDKYLEELFARPPEYDAQCQTELFLQRPPSPPYVPAKVGVDCATEILEGELFDFDAEVEPILETLVGRSVEQGLLEVMHEEELADMRKQQQEFLAERERELAELRRLEAEEQRLQAEKERRLEQERLGRELDREMQERVTAAKLLQAHIADLLPGVLHSIEPYLEVENREVLERELGPWLANEVAEEVGQMIDSRELLEELVRQILEERAAKYMLMSQRESVLSVDVGAEEEANGEEEGGQEELLEEQTAEDERK